MVLELTKNINNQQEGRAQVLPSAVSDSKRVEAPHEVMKKRNVVKVSALSILMMWAQNPIIAAEAYQQHKAEMRHPDAQPAPAKADKGGASAQKPVIGRKETVL